MTAYTIQIKSKTADIDDGQKLIIEMSTTGKIIFDKLQFLTKKVPA